MVTIVRFRRLAMSPSSSGSVENLWRALGTGTPPFFAELYRFDIPDPPVVMHNLSLKQYDPVWGSPPFNTETKLKYNPNGELDNADAGPQWYHGSPPMPTPDDDDPEPEWIDDDTDPPDPDDEELSEDPLMSISNRRYDRPSDVHMRLDNSILRYAGTPVYIRSVKRSLNVELYNLNMRHLAKVDSSDPKLDLQSPPLGFAMSQSCLLYYRRIPYRQQKQGIASDNLEFAQWSKGKTMPVHMVGMKGLRHDVDVFQMPIMNDYPEPEKAAHAIENTPGAVGWPFARSFAFLRPNRGNKFLLVLNKGAVQGVYSLKDKRVFLPADLAQCKGSSLLSSYLKVELCETHEAPLGSEDY